MARKIVGKYTKAVTLKQGALQVNECVGLYLRVSTQKQVDEGFSLDAQKGLLVVHCERMGWKVCPDHIYTDAGISGKATEDRAAFNRMLDDAKEGKIVRVIAAKLDRIARNLSDLLDTVAKLTASNCALVVLDQNFDTGTPNGKFFLQMMGAIAELEASMITGRVMSGKVQNAKEGGYNGGSVPYGYYRINGRPGFFIDGEEATAVRSIFQSYLSGQSLLGIANGLSNIDILSPSGNHKWNHVTIKNILSNGFYAGLTQWDGVEAEGTHEAIIDRTTYDQVVAKLATATRGNPNFGKAA